MQLGQLDEAHHDNVNKSDGSLPALDVPAAGSTRTRTRTAGPAAAMDSCSYSAERESSEPRPGHAYSATSTSIMHAQHASASTPADLDRSLGMRQLSFSWEEQTQRGAPRRAAHGDVSALSTCRALTAAAPGGIGTSGTSRQRRKRETSCWRDA